MIRVRLGWAWATLALLAASAHADKLKDHLAVFFEMEPQDSVVALEQVSATQLKITVADPASGKTRTLKEDVGAKPMEKLLAEANDLGLKTLHWSPPEDTSASALPPAPAGAAGTPPVTPGAAVPPGTAVAAEAAAPKKPRSARSISAERKNRMWYIATQTPLSIYVYGVAIPNAYDDVSTKARIATPMIVAPFAFAGNFWFAKNHTFEDAHRMGTAYLSIAGLYASHALAFSAINWDSDPYRYASFLSMAMYPLGIWAGYNLGEQYVDKPGRIDMQEKFALGFGALGFFTPWLYFEDLDEHSEAIFRLGLAQSVAFATAGHFLADNYRRGQNVPGGVNTGLLSHAALGVGAGLEIAALFDASSVRPWLGGALFGGTVGFMEGLYYYKDSYDSKERGLYNALGAGAGALMGGGFAFLFYNSSNSDYHNKNLITGLLVGGTWLGYCLTNVLTDGMEDRTGTGMVKDSWTDRLSVNLIPFAEPATRDRDLYLRYRIPGVSFTF
jgi:hypothetical protein